MLLWVAMVGILGLEQGPRVNVPDSRAQSGITSAVLGAEIRLARPECQKVFTDFQDVEGRPLLERLEASLVRFPFPCSRPAGKDLGFRGLDLDCESPVDNETRGLYVEDLSRKPRGAVFAGSTESKTALNAPAEYLAQQVWFVDGGDTPQCRRDGTMAAFTVPGHHVIRVCSTRFAQRFERERVAAEIIVIHEMLHTLGLGENPPSSRDITAQVTRRCGGS
jgi:hypothetical protein